MAKNYWLRQQEVILFNKQCHHFDQEAPDRLEEVYSVLHLPVIQLLKPLRHYSASIADELCQVHVIPVDAA